MSKCTREIPESEVVEKGVDLRSRIELHFLKCQFSSEDANESLEDFVTSSMRGLSLKDISNEDPKVKTIDDLFKNTEDLAKELLNLVDSSTETCKATLFSTKALEIMKDQGLIPALIAIREDSKWGSSSTRLLQLLDPLKNTIRSVFKPAMAQNIIKLHGKREVCHSCLWQRNALLVCSICHEARYCSKECQENDWFRHKKNDCVSKI